MNGDPMRDARTRERDAGASEGDAVLAVTGLSRRFGGVQALDAVSFRVARGERVALIGPNGAGKSTCFNLLGGQLRPDAGTVRVAGRDLTGRAASAVFRRGVGRTFQIPAVFASMTVAESVQLARLSHLRRLGGLWRRARDQETAAAARLLDRVGIADLAEAPCGTLAYADRKRVELAMALANDPVVLLMDEPTAGMAPGERAALMALTADLARAERRAILFTEHDMAVVFAHADRVLVLDQGRLLTEGTPAVVRADPAVRRVYLGTGEGSGSAGAAGSC